MDLTPSELEQAQKAAPGAKRFQKVEYNGRTFIFRNPTRPEYKAFRAAYAEDHGELMAYEALAVTLAVIPSPDEFLAYLDEYPGAGANKAIVSALNLLTGMASADQAK
jgi:hypothetical protein